MGIDVRRIETFPAISWTYIIFDKFANQDEFVWRFCFNGSFQNHSKFVSKILQTLKKHHHLKKFLWVIWQYRALFRVKIYFNFSLFPIKMLTESLKLTVENNQVFNKIHCMQESVFFAFNINKIHAIIVW